DSTAFLLHHADRAGADHNLSACIASGTIWRRKGAAMIEDWLNQLPDQSVLDVPTRLALIALVLVLTWIVQRVARWLIVLLVERAVGTFIRTGDDIQFEQNLSR